MIHGTKTDGVHVPGTIVNGVNGEWYQNEICYFYCYKIECYRMHNNLVQYCNTVIKIVMHLILEVLVLSSIKKVFLSNKWR
jgi:hypothetical protein